MRTLETLIDEAANVCGSYAALARRIGTTPQRVDEWKHGKRAMTPESVADLCNVAQVDGDEACRLAALAVIENPKNASRKEALRRAFFVCWALGAVLVSHDSNATKISAGYRFLNSLSNTLYIVRRWIAALGYGCAASRRLHGGLRPPYP